MRFGRHFFVLYLVGCSSAAISEPTSHQQALNDISTFANNICGSVPLDTSSTEVELSLDSKAQLNRLIKKFADIGISGAGKYKNTESTNVLQKDLATSLTNSEKCRKEIAEKLIDKLIIAPSPEANRIPPSLPPGVDPKCGPVISVMSGYNGIISVLERPIRECLYYEAMDETPPANCATITENARKKGGIQLDAYQKAQAAIPRVKKIFLEIADLHTQGIICPLPTNQFYD